MNNLHSQMFPEHKVHELKTWPTFFLELERGTKTFEVRKNDRDFKLGDVLQLREYLPSEKVFTDRTLTFWIGYIMFGGVNGIEPDYCVMQLVPMDQVTP